MSQERTSFDQTGESDEVSIFTLETIGISLLRRRWILLFFLILGLIGGFALSLRPRKFTADGMLRIEPSRSSMYQLSGSQAMSGDSGLDTKLNTEVIEFICFFQVSKLL